MKYRLTVMGMAIILMSGCAMLADMAMDAISPSKGGINTELVVGDKEQSLGANLDIKAKTVGKVVGANDNSTAVGNAQQVTVSNVTYPAWLIIVLLLGNVVFLCLPTPTTMCKGFKKLWSK